MDVRALQGVRLSEIHYGQFLLFLDADCTTERAKFDRGATLIGCAGERLAGRERQGCVLFRLEGEIILDLAGHGSQRNVGRSGGRHEYVNVARVGGDVVIAVAGEVSTVRHFPVRGINFDSWATDVGECDRA